MLPFFLLTGICHKFILKRRFVNHDALQSTKYCFTGHKGIIIMSTSSVIKIHYFCLFVCFFLSDSFGSDSRAKGRYADSDTSSSYDRGDFGGSRPKKYSETAEHVEDE